MSMEFDPPTQHQLDEIRAHRVRDGVSLANLPLSKEQATEEIKRYRVGGKPQYAIRNRKAIRVSPEKRYAQLIQERINETHDRLKAEFLERESERRSRG